MSRTGIDVSWWQWPPGMVGEDGIDYAVIKAAGIEFVVVRTTNGKTYDTSFQAHFDGVLAVDLKAAGYHYFRPAYGVSNQRDSIMENLDGRAPFFYSIDVETDDGREATEVRDDVWHMLTLMESELSCPIIVYTGEWFWGDHIRDKIMLKDYNGQPKPRANYWALWNASYGWNDGVPHPEMEVRPRGWRIDSAGDGPYKDQTEILQFTSRLHIPGSGGSASLDGNLMEERFWEFCGGDSVVVPPPPPPPADEPLIPLPTEWPTYVIELSGLAVPVVSE